MLGAITLLLCCQLAGEIIRVLSGVPIPGPVIGMMLLFAGLLIRRRFFAHGDKPEIPASRRMVSAPPGRYRFIRLPARSPGWRWD